MKVIIKKTYHIFTLFILTHGKLYLPQVILMFLNLIVIVLFDKEILEDMDEGDIVVLQMMGTIISNSSEFFLSHEMKMGWVNP
jgi:hypothetical protein